MAEKLGKGWFPEDIDWSKVVKVSLHTSDPTPLRPEIQWTKSEAIVHRSYWTGSTGGRMLTDDEVAALRAAGVIPDESDATG